MKHRRLISLASALMLIVAAACSDNATVPSAPLSQDPSLAVQGDQGPEVLSQAIIHLTVEAAARRRANGITATAVSNLAYGGGVGGIGVETAPKIYLVVWGSQWNNNDPSGEVAILQSFFGDVGGSSWLNSVTQYCQGVAKGTITCPSGSAFAGNQSNQYAGIWYDNASAAPSRPRQSQLAAEALRAAAHFGNNSGASNASVQYVIATARKNNSTGFGTQYCAWHSYTSSSTAGKVAYTNLPYITDAGSSCGANFNGLGPKAGITIVEGHELAETDSDQFPSGGWIDSGGAENGDKCAWISSGQGASANVTIGAHVYPVQSLWSNKTSNCVVSY